MTMRFNFIRYPLLLILVGFISACSPATQTLPTSPLNPSDTPLPVIETTATPAPPSVTTAGEQIQSETPSSAQSPACTVLQDLNLRTGPGTAYRPPIRVLPENTVVTPVGFNPTGIPGGSWVNVEDSSSGNKGWVNAGTQYISCNIGLASLPSVVVGTPLPPPPPKSVISSVPEGSCALEGLEYACDVVFSDEFWIQFKVLKDGQELGLEDGVEEVIFTVSKDDKVIYEKTEKAKAYCIFGGNDHCNPWVVENYFHQWKAGGPVVQPGEHLVNIEATVNGYLLTWHADFTVSSP